MGLSRIIITEYLLLGIALAAQANSTPPLDANKNVALSTFMYAEQVQSTGNGLLTQPQNLPGLALRALPVGRHLENYGSLPPEFLPSSRTNHQLICLLIPRGDASEVIEAPSGLDPEIRNMVYVNRGGKQYMRFFILPLPENLTLYQDAIKSYPHDDLHWTGEQQASGRSLTVINTEGKFPPTTIKMDLNVNMAGSPRRLFSRQLNVAPRITSYMAEARRASTSGVWDYMPEQVAVGAPHGLGGNIYRVFPPEVMRGDSTMIPLFALVNGNRDELWLDTLAKAEGMTRQQFLRDKLTPMLVDTFAELALGNGLTPEMHQQNVLLMIDRKTNRLQKIILRDMDSVQIDPLLREQRGLNVSGLENLTAGQLRGNSFEEYTMGGLRYRYAFQFRFNYEWLLRGSFLKDVNVSEIKRAADARLVADANAILGKAGLASAAQISRFPSMALQQASLDPKAGQAQPGLAREFASINNDRKYLSSDFSSRTPATYVDRGNRIVAVGAKGQYLGVAYRPDPGLLRCVERAVAGLLLETAK